MDLNRIVEPQERALSARAALRSGSASVKKRPYPQGKSFTLHDIAVLLGRASVLLTMLRSLSRTVSLIRRDAPKLPKPMTPEDFRDFSDLCAALRIDAVGALELGPQDIYAGAGVPYGSAILVTIPMDPAAFAQAPSMEAQLEVMRVYGETGTAVNELARFLRSRGYNAAPNHSMGGSIDYARTGMKAGIGAMGRHGMLLTPGAGACHRSAAVYTDIPNLAEFLEPPGDHAWVADFCASCGACVRSCPTRAIRDRALGDGRGNFSAVDYDKCCEGFKRYGCGVCISRCPFTKVSGYEKLKAAAERKRKEEDHESRTAR